VQSDAADRARAIIIGRSQR